MTIINKSFELRPVLNSRIPDWLFSWNKDWCYNDLWIFLMKIRGKYYNILLNFLFKINVNVTIPLFTFLDKININVTILYSPF